MRRIGTALIVIILTALLAATAAAAAQGVLTFVDQVEVSRRAVNLLDLVNGADSLEPELKAKLADVRVCATPSGENSRVISGRSLRSLVNRADLPQGVTTLLPAQVTVRRAVQKLDAEQVAQAYRRAVLERLGSNADNADVHSISAGGEAFLPDGVLELKVHFLGETMLGRVPAVVSVLVDGVKVDQQRVVGSVDVFAPVVVASRPLERGRVITDDDVELTRMNLANAPRGVVTDPSRVVGMRTRGGVGMGEPVDLRWVERAPLVHRGDIVTMIVSAPGLKITTKGRAEEHGYKGENLRLTNMATQRVVSGHINENGDVVVDF